MTEPNQLRIGFFSTVHPHPWLPTKGTFNAAMLRGLQSFADVTAVVPVPFTERWRRGARTDLAPGYPLSHPFFYYLPRLAPMALARQLWWSTRRTLLHLPTPDVIMGYWTDPDGTVAVRWGQQLRRPVALIVGGSDVLVLARDPARKRRMVETLSHADLILAVGTGIQKTLSDWQIGNVPIELYRRGVDRERFFPQDRTTARTQLGLPAHRPILVWAGRMVPVKGLDVALDALRHPALAHLDPLLVLIGDGPLRGAIEGQIRTAGLSESVMLAGVLAHDALAGWLAAADLIVLPSHSEGVPNVLLEAVACDRPFVASDVGGVRELTDNPHRDMVPAGNSEALAVRIAERLRDPSSAFPEVPDVRTSARDLADALMRLVDPPAG